MLIGIPEAGKRMGVSGDSARRALRNARVPLVRINERALAVEESDVAAFIASRAGYTGLGRPRRQQPRTSTQAPTETPTTETPTKAQPGSVEHKMVRTNDEPSRSRTVAPVTPDPAGH